MRSLTGVALGTVLITSGLLGKEVNLLEKEAQKKTVLEDHIITLGNYGFLRKSGQGAKTEADVKSIIKEKFPKALESFKKKRIYLFAHGGLVKEEWGRSDGRLNYEKFLSKGIYPITFLWPSDVPAILKNGGEELARKAMLRVNTPGLEFARRINVDELNRFRIIAKRKEDQDKLFEDVAFHCGGLDVWQKMKDKAFGATRNEKGGARVVAKYLAELCREIDDVEIHISGHSAGSIFMGPFVQLMTKEFGLKIKTLQLRAPACTIELFERCYLPSIKSGSIENFIVMNLTGERECNDGWSMYGKSILYLVSRGLEKNRGVALLGMEKSYATNPTLNKLIEEKRIDYIACPNENDASAARRSVANTHGSFAHDELTIEASLAQILNPQPIQ